MEPRCVRRRAGRTAPGPPAHPARRRPQSGPGQHQRRGAPLPGHRPPAARAVARRACRLQHQHAHAQRQRARHARGLPLRLRARGTHAARRHARRRARAAAAADPPDRHPQRGRRREALRARTGAGGVRHALHRRGGHAPDHAAGARRPGRAHPPARELRRGLPRPRHRPRRGHHRARRADLPRGAAVHGDDRRQRLPGLARHRRTQPRARCAQQDGPAGRGPGGIAVWQEHADAAEAPRFSATQSLWRLLYW